MRMIASAKQDEFSSVGLDTNELDAMGYFERRGALAEANLDQMITNNYSW